MSGFRPLAAFRTLTGQITALVMAAVLVGAALAGGTLFVMSATSRMGMTPELKTAAEAARIATITDGARRLASGRALAAYLRNAQAPSERIRLVGLPRSALAVAPLSASGYVRRLRAELWSHWRLRALDPAMAGMPADAVIVPLTGTKALSFVISE